MPLSDKDASVAHFSLKLEALFLEVLARKFARQDILLVLDGAPNHRSGELAVPGKITLLYLPPYSPERVAKWIAYPLTDPRQWDILA
jgi:hypothetical protein